MVVGYSLNTAGPDHYVIAMKYCLTLDLKNDPLLIAQYKEYHEKVWPEVLKSIKDSGIRQMEIYLLGNRLCMIIEAQDTFSFERKQLMDRENKKVQEWEALMWEYQQALPLARPGEKWMIMEKIFDLNEQ